MKALKQIQKQKSSFDGTQALLVDLCLAFLIELNLRGRGST